jgi:ABC-type uncharacterized transport system substrate-binding protein
MKRRTFVLVLGGVITSARRLRAQQKAMPVIGFLSASSPVPFASYVAAFHQGLGEAGYVEGRNVTTEYRWADSHYDRMPALAADLVGRKVDAIVAGGGSLGIAAAKGATSTIPIVVFGGGDLVAGLAARHAVPAIYEWREFAQAGGLISYGPSLSGTWRQVGAYVGRILAGANPADLPIQRPTRIELVINLKTAKALGLTIPPSILGRADEVIE